MNLQLGLKRISAVWWGFLGLFGLAFLGVGLTKMSVDILTGLAILAVCYMAHRLTCWIIAGFFSPQL